jgi:Acetyltransferase (GNAT) family.
MHTYRVRPAAPDDVEAIIELRLEAEQWLHARGIEQWVSTERGIQSIRDHLEGTHVVEHQGGIVASLALEGPDPDFWTAEDDLVSGLHLYKFMIARPHRGTGLGDALLDWCCERAEAAGKAWLRLDCWRTNTGLQRYYLDRGFTHIRTVTVSWRDSGALFQRPASLRLADTTVAFASSTPVSD